MGHIYGYGRVSTLDQNPDLQTDALHDAGAERLFIDKASGTLERRPELDRLLEVLLPGDVVMVWRLDRFGRSVRQLINQVNALAVRNVEFRSLTEHLDTTTAGGRLIFHVFAAVAEFERSVIVERTTAGLTAARARGRVGGRPPVLTIEQRDVARQLYDAGDRTVQQIADMFGVSRTTIYNHLGDTTNKGCW